VGKLTAAFEFLADVLSRDDVFYAPFPYYHGLARVSLTAAAMLAPRSWFASPSRPSGSG